MLSFSFKKSLLWMRTSRDMSPWYAWSKTIWTKGFIIIESRGAPFFICIWRLKRHINSQFSIQSTLWFSSDDEVNGTESASSHFLGGWISIEPDGSVHFNERPSSPDECFKKCSYICLAVLYIQSRQWRRILVHWCDSGSAIEANWSINPLALRLAIHSLYIHYRMLFVWVGIKE